MSESGGAGGGVVMVFVTAPDMETARRLVDAALEARAAACANLVPGVESHYWWQGKRERAQEVLAVFKTAAARVEALRAAVVGAHPYECPEFVVAPVAGGHGPYLDWVRAETGQGFGGGAGDSGP